MIVETPILSVHWLVHPEKTWRRVSFKTLPGDRVLVERYDGNHVHPETLPAEKARRRYSWYRRLGYAKW